jgi:hypothetical protein
MLLLIFVLKKYSDVIRIENIINSDYLQMGMGLISVRITSRELKNSIQFGFNYVINNRRVMLENFSCFIG